MPDLVESLRRVPLFAELSDEALRDLAGQMQTREFRAGQEIASEGAGGVGFFVIEDGEAEVSAGGRPLGTLKAGDCFGEIALLDSQPRTATVKATSELRCQAMTAWNFRPWARSQPDVMWGMLEAMAGLVRAANQPR